MNRTRIGNCQKSLLLFLIQIADELQFSCKQGSIICFSYFRFQFNFLQIPSFSICIHAQGCGCTGA